ncbi:MAG: IS630 family transposase [Nitrospira sp.]|nr:IS630 family transposase [Nitrospira sp.]
MGLYRHPPDKALVLGVDEKAQIPALDRTRPLLPMPPGQVERRTQDSHRPGTTSLFAALEGPPGRVIGQLHQRHRAQEFRQFLDAIDANVPAQLDVHLVRDNSGTHKTALIRRWFLKRPRFQVHGTPTSASWINLVERWLARLTERHLRRGVPPSVRALKATFRHDIPVTTPHPTPFTWTKTADDILASVARFCQRTSETGH